LLIIGPEAALAAGVVDELAAQNIPSIGPTKQLAKIETSKGFARNLLTKHDIFACPKYKIFNSLDGVKEFLQQLNDYVIKADGLKGGKGVKISGEHLITEDDALNYCQQLIDENSAFVIEEKLVGQEFSLLSFTDGKHLLHMPPVRDYKRAFKNDTGPNTGGMGSYSLENHLLPFLNEKDLIAAQEFNTATINALHEEFNQPYKGILYGGYILTKNGVKLIEYNARFGDPEAINILALLQTDFIDICLAIINGTLDKIDAKFANQATVCKYLVPNGYPDNPAENQEIDISQIDNPEQLYFAAVNAKNNKTYTTRSRSLAVLGLADNVTTAEKIAENMANKIKGAVFHREDVGVKLT
jgi:phosphoribosylamine--glycine ligase